MREKLIRKPAFSGSEKNPGKRIFMKRGMKICTKMVKISKMKNRKEKILRTKDKLAFSASLSCNLDTNIGTKAELKAPSAKMRRKKFGKRNAAKNASDNTLIPRYWAINISRTNPKIRDKEM